MVHLTDLFCRRFTSKEKNLHRIVITINNDNRGNKHQL